MEVADSSLAYDLREKCQLYAEAGIRDYWVIDIPKRFAHIYCDPSARGYQTHRRLSANEQRRYSSPTSRCKWPECLRASTSPHDILSSG
jgi:Uma2 family endonuclease